MRLQGLFFDGKTTFQVPMTDTGNMEWEISRRKPKWAIIADVATGDVIKHYKEDEAK